MSRYRKKVVSEENKNENQSQTTTQTTPTPQTIQTQPSISMEETKPIQKKKRNNNRNRNKKKNNSGENTQNVQSMEREDSQSVAGSEKGNGSGQRGNKKKNLNGNRRNQKKKNLNGPSGNKMRIRKQAVLSQSEIQALIEEHSHGQSEQAVEMISQFIDSSYKCLICHDQVGTYDDIWGCVQCFNVMHHACVGMWMDKASIDGMWLCPNCRFEYYEAPSMSCFCGRSNGSPGYDRMLVPHSCGEACGRLRVGTTCPHACMLVCHPGSCPPCEVLGDTNECFCGGTIYTTLCGAIDNGRSCGEVCSKDLSCGEHYCESDCHPGECPPCTVLTEQMCFCGEEISERLCGSEQGFDDQFGEMRTYSCERVCGRMLDCGNHFCEELCHSGECGECELLPQNMLNCPCGKTELKALLSAERTSCLDETATCEKICGKLLYCGLHRCKEKCHVGKCTNVCSDVVDVLCRCGFSSTKFLCSEVYPDNFETIRNSNLCKRKCNAKRSCGRHRCGKTCCPSMDKPNGEVHICELECPKTLRCNNHKCPKKCHKGHCPPCHELTYDDRICRCGNTVWKAPIRCGEKAPYCGSYCTEINPCGHPTPPHGCHWQGDCPPCVYLVEKLCDGGHQVLQGIPCQREVVSCGNICGKPMHCLTHKCTRMCHSGKCELAEPIKMKEMIESNELKLVRDSCGQACLKEKSCGHPCRAICHPDEPCESLCEEKVVLTCECGRKKKNKLCYKDTSSPECDDACAAELRKIQLATAFGIIGTENSGPNYSDFLVYISQVSSFFVKTFEATMKRFFDSPDEMFVFDSRDRVQRKIVMEYARYYFLKVSNYRDVSAPIRLQKRRTSKIPKVLLSQASKIRGIKEGIIIDINDVMTTSTLIFYNLDYRVGAFTLKSSLGGLGEECKIFWVDHNTSVAIFGDRTTAERALERLEGSEWKVRMLEDAEPILFAPKKKQTNHIINVTNDSYQREEPSEEDKNQPPVNPYLVLEDENI